MGHRTIARFILTVAVLGLPLTAEAQPRRRRHRDTQPEPPAQTTQAPEAQPAAQTGGGDNGGMTFTTEEATQPAQPTPDASQTGATGAGTGDTGTGTSGDTGTLTVMGGEVTAQRHPLREEIYAVQQIYALRNHRVELSPTANFSLNDPFVQHTGFGLTANYWITNVLSVGVTGVFFQGLNVPSDVNRFVGRSTGLVVPINEYQMAAALNFSYVPLYGKFSMFNRFIFHWDLYLTAGVGIMRTRPIAAIDPEVRSFEWGTRIMFDAGLGVRVFVTRSVGITLELRNFVYPELLESTRTNRDYTDSNGQRVRGLDEIGPAPDFSTTCANCRRNQANWTSANELTDNVMLSIGLTVFLPFGVTYRLPK